ncbi:uncharacterized protein LOC126184309 [Schistocerca cancellata]|uniref:uncharacterized protein LOC126184309 n=1 Tax=Schistocerca cancellata TaxID=274614 RepID=UPI002117927A|nr:uncharacterized protein LOC126184309 [Schistocerca cancellata]
MGVSAAAEASEDPRSQALCTSMDCSGAVDSVAGSVPQTQKLYGKVTLITETSLVLALSVGVRCTVNGKMSTARRLSDDAGFVVMRLVTGTMKNFVLRAELRCEVNIGKRVARILSNRPLSIVNDENNGQLETDWRHSEFINECLLWHNVYRQRHSARPLALCPQLCSYAQAWANHLAHVNTFYYRTDRDIGQNLFCRPTTTLQADVTGQEVVTYWYSAVRQYNYLKEPDILHANVNAGHFTQLVWASTTHVGLGKARSRSGKVLVVAHYRPVGNVSGLFQQNVFPPLALPQPRRRDDSDSESGSASESSASANAS